MDDQGENIIFLAREILNSSAQRVVEPRKSLHMSIGFKTLCLTAILAASGGGIANEALH